MCVCVYVSDGRTNFDWWLTATGNIGRTKNYRLCWNERTVDTCIVLFVLLYIYSWNGLLDGEEEISSCRESLGKQPGSIIDSNASPAQRQKV